MSAEKTEKTSEMKNLLSANVSVNLGAKVLYILTRFFLPPLTLSYVTLEEYGIWAACFILVAYLGMSAFGVSNVYIRYVAEYNAKGETDKINRLLSTGLTVISGLSVVLLAGLWFSLPVVIRLLKIPPHLNRTGFILIFGTAATFMLDLTFGAFSYVLAGLQRLVEQTIVWVATFCLEAVLIVTLLVSGAGIYALLWAFVIRYIVATTAYVWLCYRAIPGLSLGIRHFDRSVLRLFYGYGAIVQLSGLLGMFLYSIEKLIAGVFIGVSATGIIDIGEKLPVMASQIPASMNSVFLPAMLHMNALERRQEIAKLYVKGARYMNQLMALLLGFLAAFSHLLIRGWIGSGDRYSSAATILTLVCLPYQMNELTGPCSAFHRSSGRPSRELVYPITQLVLVCLSVSIGFAFIGKTVLVIVSAIALSMVASAVFYIFYTNRFLSVSAKDYLWKVMVPGVAPYILAFALAFLVRPFVDLVGGSRWTALGFLALCGLVYAPVAAFTFYRVLCDWGEREFLRKQLLHTLRGLVRRARALPPADSLKVEGA